MFEIKEGNFIQLNKDNVVVAVELLKELGFKGFRNLSEEETCTGNYVLVLAEKGKLVLLDDHEAFDKIFEDTLCGEFEVSEDETCFVPVEFDASNAYEYIGNEVEALLRSLDQSDCDCGVCAEEEEIYTTNGMLSELLILEVDGVEYKVVSSSDEGALGLQHHVVEAPNGELGVAVPLIKGQNIEWVLISFTRDSMNRFKQVLTDLENLLD